jgi:multidrug efflux pump subunit AcrA (membrane-fusion protein)
MSASLYRPEALEAHAQGDHYGAMVRVSSRWVDWGYRVVFAFFAAVLLFGALAVVNEHAVGPAIVRVVGREEITVSTDGVVEHVAVKAGDRVRPGDVLVQLRAQDESAELARLQRQFDAQLAERLRDPAAAAIAASLAELRARRDLAQEHVLQRQVRATKDGVVSDVRARDGQRVSPGDLMVAVAHEGAELSVLAVLPGHYRPMLHAGGPLRLELQGFPFAYQDLTIERVSDEIVGPTEIRRFLGQDVSDTVALAGPAVLVRAKLTSPTFVANGKTYAFFDGMAAKATAKVRARSFLLSLLPGLDEVSELRRGDR